jgi:hypothetical protein
MRRHSGFAVASVLCPVCLAECNVMQPHYDFGAMDFWPSKSGKCHINVKETAPETQPIRNAIGVLSKQTATLLKEMGS